MEGAARPAGKWVSNQMNFPNTRKAKSSAQGFWMGAREQTSLGLKRPDYSAPTPQRLLKRTLWGVTKGAGRRCLNRFATEDSGSTPEAPPIRSAKWTNTSMTTTHTSTLWTGAKPASNRNEMRASGKTTDATGQPTNHAADSQGVGTSQPVRQPQRWTTVLAVSWLRSDNPQEE